MPDFFDRLKQDIANRQSKEQIDSANLTPLQRIKNNRIKNIQEQNAPLYKQRGVDTSIAATGGTEQGLNDEYEKRITDKEAPFMENRIGYSGTEYDQQGNDTVSKTAMAESFLDNGLTSLQRGTGTFVDGWGSIIQIVNAAVGGAMNPANFKKTFNELMESNNELSSMMQEFGKEMAAENTDFQTDDLKNPTFSFDTFLNPEFWSTYGGEFIPQLAEIAASYGAGGLLKNAGKMGVEAVVKGVAKKTGLEIAEEVAQESAKKGLLRKVLGTAKTTTKDAFVKGAAEAGVEHTLKKGSGILGAIATDSGNLTKGFAETLRATGAGSFTNLSVSLRNAGEIYNTYKNAYKLNEDGSIQRDESGQPIPLFTKEELGQMARDTFVTNSQYIGADILSWGLTYGKGLSSVKGVMGSMTEEAAKKTAGEIVSKGVSPFLKNLRKLGTKMAFEGAEETVQETYEEWSKMKSYSDIHGSLDGYQGKISQEYDTKGWGPFSSGFWDYYKSKDSESVRVISAALGAIAGGVFNVSQVFNKQADNAYKLEDRWNNINKLHNTPEGKDSQRRDIYRQMSEAVMQDKGGLFTEFIDKLYNNGKGKIDESDYKRFAGTYDQIASNYGKIKDLKMKGQKAFMLNVADEIRFNDDLNEANNKYRNSLKTLEDAYDTYVDKDGVRDTQKFEKQKAELDKNHQAIITPLVSMIAGTKKNQKNLILGKNAKPVEYKVEFKQDPVTGEFIDPVYTEIENEQGLTQNERESAQKKLIEELQAEEGTMAGTVKGWWNKAKSYFGKNAVAEQQALESKNNPAPEEKTGIEAQVDGAIEALANSFGSTEEIDAEILTNEEAIKNISLSEESSVDDVNTDEIENNRKEELKNLYDQYKTEDSDAVALDEEGTREEKFINEKYNQEIADLKSVSPSENNQKVAELTQRNEDLKKAKEFKSKPAEPKTTIQQTDQEPNFGTKDYDQFKNKGSVGSHAIDALALQILDGKELTKKQAEVYEAFKSEVDEIVDNPSKFVDSDETLSEEEKSEVKDMMKNISGKKSINSAPEVKSDSDEKITVKSADPDIFDDRRDMRQEENKYFNKEKIVSSGIDIVSSALSKLRRKKGKAVEFFKSDFGDADFEFLSQSIGVSSALKKVYPGMNTNVYVVRNMQNTIGVKSLGFALAGQIYIDESKWNQNEVFMHEVAHIYFALTKESDDTQRILNSAFKNKDLVNDILNRYEDRIQYRKKDGELVYRSDLFNNYENLSQEERDDLIDRLLKEGFITNVPLLEQEVIADEVFAAYLQGPLSDKYTKYFTEKDSTLEDEPRRKYLVKKWWGKVKQDGANLGNKKDRESFFKSILTEEEQEAHSDSLNSILDQFTKGIEGKNISAEGRASLEQDENQKISDRLAAIERSIESERQAFVNDETLVQKLESGSLENLIDDIDFNNFFDDDNRFAYTNKITPLMMAFTRKMNKGISYLNNLNGKKSNWKQLPYVKADQLRYQMSEMAKVSWSGSDFIRRMESSPFYEVTEFMKHLDKINRGDKNMVMQMFYWHENNTSNISSFKNYVNPSGESQVELNLSNKEKTQYENLMENIKEPFFGNNRKVDRDLQDEYIALNESLSNIQSGDYTRSDINNVTRFLVRKEYGIDSESLIAANRININGKAYALDQIIVSLATDESGNGFIGEIRNVEGARNSKQKQFIKKVGNKFTSGVYKLDANKQSIIKPGIRMVVQGLINENRKYRADYTVVHADNNMHQARIIDNYLSRNFKYLKEDVSRTTRNEFISKHSLKNNEGKGMLSNKVAGFIYDKISNGGDIDLLEYGGIQNAYNNDKRMTLKTSDPVTERLSQFVTFLNTDKSGTYIMDLGRFSDSTRAFYTEMPKTDISEIVTFGKNGIEFTNRAFLDNIYNTHKALGYNGTFDEFKGLLMGSIRDQIAFVNDNLNSFKNDKKFQKLTDPQTGLLNKDGQMKVAEFEMNQIINGTNFTEIFFPSFQMQKANGDNELVKRAKSASSPMFTFPNTRVEPIYLEDIKVNELDDFEATDSGFYILEDDAERFRSAGGNMMPLGNSFKLIHTGIERNAPGLLGQNIYNKGFATVLNDEVVIKNPALRGAYELLKARKAKYEAEYGKPSMNLLDGTGNYIPMIVPISANKSNNLPDFYDHKSTEEKSALMNFQSITDAFESGSADFNEALNQLDQMYYEDGDFIGADGSNFGIQQVMDIDKDFANTSVQFVKSLTSNMALNENEDQIFDILKDIQNLSEQQLSAGMETLMNGSDSEIRDFIKNLIDPNLIDQTQQFLLFNENVSLQTPAVKQIVKNTIANYIKQNGLKIKTPGGILREKPSLFEKEYATSSDLNATSGNYGLSFYQNNSKGTVSKGEVVIPESMVIGSDSNKPNKLNVRKYFVSNSTDQIDLEEQMKLAKMEANNRGTSVGKVFNASGKHIGFYAAGDTILATRIPSHGIQSTGVFEVVGTTGEKGNNIQLPNEFKKTIGSDNDGDQIFVQHKGKRTGDWNKILDKIEKHYLNPQMQDELRLDIDFKKDAKKAVAAAEKIWGTTDQEFTLPFSSRGRQKAFEDTLIAKANVGLAANLHTTLGMFRNYGIGLKVPINIDGNYADQFMDAADKSISINSAKNFNIILDNSKNAFANKLGIDTNTIPVAMVLTNLGFDLDQVAIILNSPMLKRYSALKSNNTSAFNKDEKYNVMEKLRVEFGVKRARFSEINIDTKNIKSQNTELYNLISTINQMESELSDIGAVLSIHNTMTVNPFEINDVIRKFDNRMDPENNRQLITNDNFKNSPIVQNYKNVLLKNQDVQKKLDPVYSGNTEMIYNEITGLSTKEMSSDNHKSLYSALDIFHTSQALGLNNVDRSVYESLTKYDSDPITKRPVPGPRNIFENLSKHMISEKKDYSFYDKKNPNASVTNFENSLLFSQGMNLSLKSNNKYISLNSDFFNNSADDSLRTKMINEFSALPTQLKNDLMLYDLMKNGWSGPNSLFPLFESNIKRTISVMSKENKATNVQLQQLKNKAIFNNPDLFRSYDNAFVYDRNGNRSINPDLAINNESLLASFKKGEPFIFRTKDKYGNDLIQKFQGFDKEMRANLKLQKEMTNPKNYDQEYLFPAIQNQISKSYPSKYNANPNLDYITIKNPTTLETGVNDRIFNETNTKPVNMDILKEGRAMLDGFFQPDKELSIEQLDAGRDTLNQIISRYKMKKVNINDLSKNLEKGFYYKAFKEFQKYVPAETNYYHSLGAVDEYGLTYEDQITVYGLYGYGNIIISNEKALSKAEGKQSKKISTDVLFHEQLHAVLYNSLEKTHKSFDKKFHSQMTELFLNSKKYLEQGNNLESIINIKDDSDFDETFEKIYGFLNLQEFVAEAISNKDFQEILTKIPSDKGYKSNIFSEILKLIREMFSVKTDANMANDVIGLIGMKIENGNQKIKKKSFFNFLTKPLNMNVLREGREMRSDWWSFSHDLSREEYDEAMEYSKEFTEERKKSMHNIYVNQKLEADRLKTVINADTVKEMSNDELLTLFDSRSDIGKKYGNGIGFGNRNKFAYAEITLPIVRELATRAATDQTLLTGREYDGNDISLLQKYFMTGNVPSNHPAVQNLVRRMESEYKIFLNERNKIVGKINDATNQLYKEQLGYEPYGGKGVRGKVINYIKNIETNLLGDKEQIYKKLYGPLINVETKEDGSYKELGYKSREVIEKEYKEGNISEAQYNFYNVSRETTDALKSFALPPGKSGRTNYIPHVAPANWEILSRRGLLGLMVNAKTVDEKINDVKMDFENPLTGEMMKGVSFKLITDMYNTLSASENRSNKHALDYVKLKRKAIILNKKGINQDGSAIFQSPIEIGGALGDVFVDRFASGRSVKAQDFPSMDLNKAFVDYTHATLFQHGNENFQGFKKMVPVIDGILAQADANKDKNIAAYVDKVWKQYFIGGQKQSSIPNIPALEAMGITSDKVVDYITKGSLVYWLGWKGLAMGAGAYAIGNVLIGKFNNVVEAGGTEWLKGEKRFWMGKSGKFEITDPFKGIREAMTILKNAGFMDINVYDDVNMDNRNSIEKNLINIALFPMTWSEKWIQGVHFLGKLNDQEWEDLKGGNTIDPGSLTKYEDDIKAVHGRGYQPTDQRMIQMYSWGRAMMQFNRYIPTMFNSLFGKKDIDRYGNVSIGTYTALLETIQKGYRGEWNPKTFMNYYKNLDANERKKLNSALVTMGLVSVLGAVNTFTNSTAIDKLISDSHLILNSDRLAGKLVPAPVAALDNMF